MDVLLGGGGGRRSKRKRPNDVVGEKIDMFVAPKEGTANEYCFSGNVYTIPLS